MTRRILVTGHNGYVGSVLTPLLRTAGYDVTGLDTGLFRDCTLLADSAERIPAIDKDIRDVKPGDLEGYHAVVHLAALSNDPLGDLSSDWTSEINFRASVRLATLAKQAKVSRFLFSSSCIMYGAHQAAVVTEDSPLDPQTTYARSKVAAELAIGDLAADGFSPTFLRNGTIYGVSPRMRFDTVLNDFVGSAMTTGKVTVHSNGRPWRPVVHIEDAARAFLAVLEAPIELVHNQSFNTGSEELNCQIGELAETAARIAPNCRVQFRAESAADHRTYKADFSKFARCFPDFAFKWNPQTGARDLFERLRSLGLTYSDFVDQRFTRVRWLRRLIDARRLDASLRWARAAGKAS